MEDRPKISNADYEIRRAAKAMDVKTTSIHIAKSKVGNDRAAVYEWIKQHKGQTISIEI